MALTTAAILIATLILIIVFLSIKRDRDNPGKIIFVSRPAPVVVLFSVLGISSSMYGLYKGYKPWPLLVIITAGLLNLYFVFTKRK